MGPQTVIFCLHLLPLIYPIFACVDPDTYTEHGHGSTKLLNRYRFVSNLDPDLQYYWYRGETYRRTGWRPWPPGQGSRTASACTGERSEVPPTDSQVRSRGGREKKWQSDKALPVTLLAFSIDSLRLRCAFWYLK